MLVKPQKPKIYSFFEPLPDVSKAESFETVLARPGIQMERIVSYAHQSEADFWYQQDWEEWVLVLKGVACLAFDTGTDADSGPEEQTLKPGQALLIPAQLRHRVVSTDPSQPTIWLAIHLR